MGPLGTGMALGRGGAHDPTSNLTPMTAMNSGAPSPLACVSCMPGTIGRLWHEPKTSPAASPTRLPDDRILAPASSPQHRPRQGLWHPSFALPVLYVALRGPRAQRSKHGDATGVQGRAPGVGARGRRQHPQTNDPDQGAASTALPLAVQAARGKAVLQHCTPGRAIVLRPVIVACTAVTQYRLRYCYRLILPVPLTKPPGLRVQWSTYVGCPARGHRAPEARGGQFSG